MKAILQKLLLPALLLVSVSLSAQYKYLNGTFDSGVDDGWQIDPADGHDRWTVENATIGFSGEQMGSQSRLVTPAVDIVKASKPIFMFDYRQNQYDGIIDPVMVYARTAPDAEWILLFEGKERQKEFETFSLVLPDSLFTAELQFSFVAENRGGAGVYIDNVMVIETNVCITPPRDFILKKLSQSTAEMVWITDTVAVNTRLVISSERITSPETANVTAVLKDTVMAAKPDFNTYTIDKLKGGVTYYAYVQADCNYGDLSEWTELVFTTTCEALGTPYNDDFDNYRPNTGLGCWEMLADDDDYLPELDTLVVRENDGIKDTTNAVYFYVGKDKFSFLYTPEFAVDDIRKMALSLDVYAEEVGSSSYSTSIDVGVITNPVDPTTFAPVYTISPTADETWQRVDVSFAKYTGDAYGDFGKFIAFRVGNAELKSEIWMDNVQLDIAGCFAPQMVSVEEVKAKEVKLSWIDMAGSQSFKVRVSDHELTTAELDVASDSDVTVDTAVAIVTGLIPNKEYFAYVQSDCGAWSKAFVFSTNKVWTVGYSEGFGGMETADMAGNGWLTGHKSMSNGNWYIPSTSYAKINTSNNHTGSDRGALNLNNTSSYNPFVIFPELDVEDISKVQFRFFARLGAMKEGIDISLCTSQDISTAERIVTIYPEEKTNTYYEYIVTFENYEGDGRYIAISAVMDKKCVATNSCYFDDLRIEEFNPCNRPQAVKVAKVTASSAEVTWSPAAAVLGKFVVEYKAEEDKDWISLPVVDTCVAELENLVAGTTYQVKLRAVCDDTPGAETYSEYSATKEFTTTYTMAVPYFEDFTKSSSGKGKSPAGWICFNDRSTSTSYIPYVYATAWSGTVPQEIVKNSLYFETTKSAYRAYAVMPELTGEVEMNELAVEFYIHTNSTSDTEIHDLEVGVMTDPLDTATFTSVSVVKIAEPNVSQYEVVSLKSYVGNGRYLAFRVGSPDAAAKPCIDNIKVDRLTECVRISKVDITAIGKTTATAEWNKANAEAKWNVALFDHEVEYDSLSTAKGNLFTEGSTTTSELPLTGLKPNTMYWLAVQAVTDNCVGDWSSIVTFRTECSEKETIPYFEDFDSYSDEQLLYCFISKGGDSNSKIPKTIEAESSYPDYQYGAEKGNTLRMYGDEDYYSYLIFPEFDKPINELQLRFQGRSYTSESYLRKMEIGVMEDIDSTFLDPTVLGKDKPTSDSLFTPIHTVELSTFKQWEEIVVALDGYTGKGKRIAMRIGHDETDDSYVYIDHLTVEPAPACTRIVDLAVNNISSTTADLKWTAKEEKNWNLKVALSPINPADDNAETVLDKPITTNPYTIENLKPNTRYYAYIQRVNKTDDCVGAWSAPVMFTTECSAIDFGFFDNFESNRDLNGEGTRARCWTTSGTTAVHAYPDEINRNWGTMTPEDSICLVINNSSRWDYNEERNYVYTSYVCLPELNADSVEQAQISFRAYRKLSNGGQFEVGVMTDPLDPSTFVSVYTGRIPEDVDDSKEWTKYSINFLDYTNDDYGEVGKCIAIRALPGQYENTPEKVSSNCIYIDDVSIEPYNPCAYPTALAVDTMTDNSVTLSWLSSKAEKYRVVVSRSESLDTATALVDSLVESNPAVIENLPANTALYAKVMVLCDNGEKSGWTQMVKFRTPGCNSTLPYMESYEEVPRNTSNQIPKVIPACYNGYSSSSSIGYGDPGDNAYSQSGSGRPYTYGSTYISSSTNAKTGKNMLSVMADGYAFLPEFDEKDLSKLVMRFYLYSTGDDIEIGVIEDVKNMETYTSLCRIDVDEYRSKLMLCEVDFSQYADIPSNARIAIHSLGADGEGASAVTIDDMVIDYKDRLWKPGKVNYVSATDTSVAFNWTTIGIAEEYDVAFVEHGAEVTTESITTVDTTYLEITGLEEFKKYDVYVRSRHGEDVSEWTDVFMMQTYHKAAALPYSQDFEDAAENDKWILTSTDNFGKPNANWWVIDGAVTVNGSKALYITNDSINHQWQYQDNSSDDNAYAWAYRTVNVEHAGVYVVELEARTDAYFGSTSDYLAVDLRVASATPTIGTTCKDIYSGDDFRASKANVISSGFASEEWKKVKAEVVIDEPGYYNLLCYWYNVSGGEGKTYKPAAIDSIRIYEKLCVPPRNLQITALTDTVVSISWIPGATKSWEVIVGTIDVGENGDPKTLKGDSLIFSDVVETPNCRVVVPAGSPVVFYVREECAPTATYQRLSTYTACAPTKLPFVEHFSEMQEDKDKYNFPLDCWQNIYGGLLAAKDNICSPDVDEDTTLTISESTWAILPIMSSPINKLQIEFEAAHSYYGDYYRTFDLGVMTNPHDASTFESLYSVVTSGNSSTNRTVEFGQYYYSFANYVGDARYIAFRVKSGTFYIDDIGVSILPDCPQPFDLDVENITSDGADLTWQADQEQSSWRVLVTTERNLSDKTLDAMVGGAFVDTVTSPSVHVSGLEHSTQYYAYVRSLCETAGAWSMPVELFTAVKPLSLPYEENFDDEKNESIPISWLRYDIDYDEVLSTGMNKPLPMQHVFYELFTVKDVETLIDDYDFDAESNLLYSSMNGFGDYYYYNWVVSPEIEIDGNAMLSFDFMLNPSRFYSNDKVLHDNRSSLIRVLVSTDNGLTWPKEQSIEISDNSKADYDIDEFISTWKRLYIDLSKYQGDTIRFAFYVAAVDRCELYAYFDNVSVRCAEEHKLADMAYENHDYEGYGFEFDYSEMAAGEKVVTRYANGATADACDSIISLTLDVRATQRRTIEDMMCAGDDEYTKHNFLVSEPGTYISRQKAVSGADSITMLVLGQHLASLPVEIEHSMCSGTVYEFGGERLTESGVYRDTVGDRYGCDSITILILTVSETIEVDIDSTICAGDVYEFAGRQITESGVYRDTVPSVNKCDSVTILTLTVAGGNVTTVTEDVMVEELPYVYEGDTIVYAETEPGLVRDTVLVPVEGTECNDSILFEITVISDVAVDNADVRELTLSPNPVERGETVVADFELSGVEREVLNVSVYNTSGTEIRRFTVQSTPVSIVCDFASGVYLVRITTTSGDVYQGKVVVR